jgi:hypothetical protein
MFVFPLFHEEKILTLREEYRLNIFHNRALRRIFRAKRDEITGGRSESNRSKFDSFRKSKSRLNSDNICNRLVQKFLLVPSAV